MMLPNLHTMCGVRLDMQVVKGGESRMDARALTRARALQMKTTDDAARLFNSTWDGKPRRALHTSIQLWGARASLADAPRSGRPRKVSDTLAARLAERFMAGGLMSMP